MALPQRTMNPRIATQASRKRASNTILVAVRFGRPSEKCINFGICSVKMITQEFTARPNTCQALLTQKNGWIYLIIDRALLNEKLYRQHLETGWFRIDENYTLCKKTCQSIGIHEFTFKPGYYKVDFEQDSIRVAFN
ncbi:MAG: hypothetical protein AAFP19_17260 [Bacteroidota bacterium]